MSEILAGEYFDSEFENRAVLDGGAHKGYYAIRALTLGAKAVCSYEPEGSNYAALLATWARSRFRDRWTIERTALSDKAGNATLHVSNESWAHSLLIPAGGSVVATEEIQTTTLSRALSALRDRHPGCDIILKLNIEGLAGSVLLSTDATDLLGVVEIWCEFEANDPCPRGEVDTYLGSLGFRRTWQEEGLARYTRASAGRH